MLQNPRIISVFSGLATSQAVITDRPSHLLMYKIDGESIYYLRNKEIHLTAGNILFVPEHETYSFRKVSPGDSRYCLINFHADIQGGGIPQVFVLPTEESAAQIFRQMERCWRVERTSGVYDCLSLFYQLISLLVKGTESDYTTTEQKAQILPAVEYLEKYMFDSRLKISHLPEMCKLSAPTFRRLFLSQFGVSPKKYMIRQRMRRAKAVLESGEYESIGEVARMVGYEDPLYFSRHFKEFYGIPPTHI